jgi:dTDP-4-dehydrorhamnose reductase
MHPFRVVVTGSRGQVARSLLEIGAAEGADIVAVGRPLLDLTDPRTVEVAIAAARPHVVVSAAAYTDTEKAEIEPSLAETINVAGAAAVAQSARKLGIPIIHLSTAYVFDGRKSEPFNESDPIAPLNAYGWTKAQGELAVAAAHPDHVILRASLVFGPFGRNFLTVMLALAEQRREIPVVADQLVNPTSTHDLGRGILRVARKLVSGTAKDPYGTFHLAGAAAATPADLAAAIFSASAARGGPSARAVAIPSSQYVTRLKRPLNSSLDSTKIANVHGVALPPWQSSLQACFGQLPKLRS